MKQATIGIDIGGTKIAGGILNNEGQLIHFNKKPTKAAGGLESSLGQVFLLIDQLINLAGGKNHIKGIGICSPGPCNPKTGVVFNPPNLPGWHNIALAQLVQKKFGLKGKIENDANAAGLAETLIGAAADYRDVFYVTISTGIGTGIIIDKKIYHGKNGVAGEGGHVSINPFSKHRCGCGSRGCIESLASGPSMVRRAKMILDHKKESLIKTLTHDNLDKITPRIIAAAARRGDPIARSILKETGFYLGVWLGGIISLLDPEAIVIGGGVSQIGEPLFNIVRKTIPRYTINRKFADSLPILPAKLKKNVGVYGAASLFLSLSYKAG